MKRLANPSARLQNLLPSPDLVDPAGGTTRLPDRPRVTGPDAWVHVACRLLAACGARPGGAAGGDITLRTAEGMPGGYRLGVAASGTTLEAADEDGVRHGVQTLLQLLDPAFGAPAAPGDTPRELALVRIEDAPTHRWRGAHLDVARHFHPLPWLFTFVDALAAHKFNVLHLHLTDDQGWRFEVPGHPRLTEVGAHRPGTRYPGWAEHDGIPRGGYYSQAQLRGFVVYAAERGITVVPEVDVPGHVRALLAAYPEYGWGAGQPVATDFGVFPEVLWPDDRAVRLVEDIFTDLLAVFPSEVVHIGGDECPRTQWRDNPDAHALAASRGLGGVDELQRRFTLHLRDWLAARGRRVVGWDEILGEGDVEDAIIMSWRGTRPPAARPWPGATKS